MVRRLGEHNIGMDLPKAVLFDWDGTLVDTFPGIFAAHNHVRKHYGMEQWSEDEYREVMRHSARDIYPKIYGDDAEAAMKVLYDFIETNHLLKLDTIKGAKTLLDEISAAGLPMAVVSNKRHKYLIREIEHLGWEHYFLAAVGAGEADADKPERAPLDLVLRRMGLATDDIWYVGDTETDLEMCRNAACKAVLMLNEEDKSGLIEKYNPFLVSMGCNHLQKTIITCKQRGIKTTKTESV